MPWVVYLPDFFDFGSKCLVGSAPEFTSASCIAKFQGPQKKVEMFRAMNQHALEML